MNINVRLIPRSSRQRIDGWRDGRLEVVRGERSRDKVVRLDADPAVVRARLRD
jgi:uncharacterized protein YggU (UPF0235/DUF167 family)